MVIVPTFVNNLKAKVDDLDVSKLKNVSMDLKRLTDLVDEKFVKIENLTD